MIEVLKTVLLIEDNADDAELTLSVLKASLLKAQIVHVKDGAEALDYIFARTSKHLTRAFPHLILLDLKIPKISGLEVLRKLRASPEGANVPVIVFTSSKEQSDIVESYRLNVNSYLQKPINFDEYEATVRRLGIYWIAMNQYPPSWEKVGNR